MESEATKTKYLFSKVVDTEINHFGQKTCQYDEKHVNQLQERMVERPKWGEGAEIPVYLCK